MGDLRFTVPNMAEFDPRVWETAYITGIEGIPWLCHHSIGDQQFSIGREIEESGKLNIVWPTECLGNVCLSTTCLRGTAEPYVLAVEIARGTVFRLKSQTHEWQRVGLKLPDSFFPIAESAQSHFLEALTSCNDAALQHRKSLQAINLALQASVELCKAFATQSLDARCNSEGRLSTLLGAQLQSGLSLQSVGEALRSAFNLVCVSAEFGEVETPAGGQSYSVFDQQVEWANQSEQRICIGPLVDFRDGRLPEWMFLLDEGFDSILDAACSHAQRTVERYLGKTHLWNCATGLNVPNKMGWSDEEVLRMAVSLIETVRRGDSRSPVLLSIDQPWSEYLRNDENGISPLHFADALIRADLGLSGLALEISFDKWPEGSFARDPIEINKLIDRWSMLGLPLMVTLSASTGQAENGSVSGVASWHMDNSSGQVAPDSIIRLLMSKPSVHAVIWNHLSDQVDDSRCAGLWDFNGKPRPLLTDIAKIRRSYLH